MDVQEPWAGRRVGRPGQFTFFIVTGETSLSAIEGFCEETFTAEDYEDYTLTLFRKGEGPGVILLHELPGLTHETVEFAEWIAHRGFHVVMPLLFGKPLQSVGVGLLKAPFVCVRREFNNLGTGRSSAITGPLRALCRKVHAECGGRGIGAIGMCYTGGFVFAMMLEAAMLGPVTAQPSLPLFKPQGLDVGPEIMAHAASRSDDISLLGLRFEEDVRCPAARFQRLQASLNSLPGSGRQRFRSLTVPGKGHSTLTLDYQSALDRGVDTREHVLQHLRSQLCG